jgi:hypothetical protein
MVGTRNHVVEGSQQGITKSHDVAAARAANRLERPFFSRFLAHKEGYGVPGEPMSNIHANNIQHSKKMNVEW